MSLWVADDGNLRLIAGRRGRIGIRLLPPSPGRKRQAFLPEPAPAKPPSRFEIEHDPQENPDRAYVLVDGTFDVAIIRTGEGVVVDVYPRDGFETIATACAFDSDIEQESPTN